MELDRNEALRYLGAGGREIPEDLRNLVEEEAQRLEAVQPRFTYRVFALERQDGICTLPEAGLVLEGQNAKTMLADCDRCILLAATLGSVFDSLLRSQEARDMARAVVLDACGSAGVEFVCNEAEREISARLPGVYLTDRFSPGYGDLPLHIQPRLCAALDAERRIGLHVTDSFLLNPRKSVTAILGIADRPQMRRIRGCAYCSMVKTCTLRKRGMRCDL